MTRLIRSWIGLTLLVAVVLNAQSRTPSGSTTNPDQRIEHRVAHYLAAHSEYRHIKFSIDDQIVTLSGAVALHSSHRALVEHVRHLAEVRSVEDRIVLDPPAVPDELLYPKIRQKLADSGFRQISFEAHEGWVSLRGPVRSERDRDNVIALARNVPGVREVECHLSVMEMR